MKICTDACLFGALIPTLQGRSNVLDIGTGTGLLSLMFAQKNADTIIDAVEIDAGAAGQAKENFAASPWSGRLNIFNVDILAFKSERKYDRIISNPPFFEDGLRSPDQNKNSAKHDTTLGLSQLLHIVEANLKEQGLFAVLLPYHRLDHFIQEAAKLNFHLTQQILVKQTVKHDFFRGILFFSRIKKSSQNVEIIIKNAEGNYTKEFVEALKDYYLHL